ncbi:uncharacterized protein OCT59_008695 [Rhizophagus irregularis]|uniref:BTB/POZ protein n=2 Tax=Rhizophagus irregularis TaxID=588596 RepID=U9SWL5_RHIID|nr:BTB/POZ protein [Rhizophagus irregularis DAOM 181602=DAOM 197198]EXX71404.1 hypothetical protein RirG_078740 [Rhizophagus irregularis DAOM 197198w]POG63076.1 BTB/POZ protein [Rhizophagus irregularis DAOM 181602=DAOM 197198]UZO17338.1 hypothetical protein OCT59_008695 [Rhizophagus irregularis]|eukprot:XP_025169942.1 BTB/POZ protein [Rhizophagus irregularis DAOM 181602=DAOM 197198]
MSSKLSNVLHKEYNDILESTEFYDTEILVGEYPYTETFKVHSLILKIRSPYFRAALSNCWIKKENNIIKLKKPNISVKIFNILINYIYSSNIDLSMNNIKTNVKLLIAADELCLGDLCNFIEKYFLENKRLLEQNLVLIQDITTKFSQFKELSRFYKKTIRRDPSLIFKASDFINIKEDTLLYLLEKNDHSLRPIEIWDKLMEWCIAQSSELLSDASNWTPSEIEIIGNFLQPFIPYINFEEITPSEFYRKIKPFKDIFDNNFYVKILEYYSFNYHKRNQRNQRNPFSLSYDDDDDDDDDDDIMY